jgi:hypothetical protein
LALDLKNHVLFAACGQSGIPAVTPPLPMMVILSAEDGKIITSVPAQRTEDTRSRRFAMWRVAAIVAGGIIW